MEWNNEEGGGVYIKEQIGIHDNIGVWTSMLHVFLFNLELNSQLESFHYFHLIVENVKRAWYYIKPKSYKFKVVFVFLAFYRKQFVFII